jgi:hypothetical protein
VIAALTSPLLRWAAVAVLAGGLFGWARIERAGRQHQAARADAAEAALAGRDRAIAALEARAGDLAQQAAQRTTIARTIHAAPRTNACADSPAVRSLLDGLRQPAAGDGARQPADLPGRAAGAGRP